MVLITYGVCAFTVTASADDKPHNKKYSNFKEESNSFSIKHLISKLKTNHDKDDKKHDEKKGDDRVPIDRRKGDGKPAGHPGFVWVGERVTVVRDHR